MCLSSCAEEEILTCLLKPSCKERVPICSFSSSFYTNMWFGSSCELKEFMLKEFISEHTKTEERILFYHQTKWGYYFTIFPRKKKKRNLNSMYFLSDLA